MISPGNDNPDEETDEARLFRSYRTAEGTIESIDGVRRNGVGVRLQNNFVGNSIEESSIQSLLQTYGVLMYNLRSVERRIWVKLLLGSS